MASVENPLLTVEEYALMPEDGRRSELVRGRRFELPSPHFLQGRVGAAV